MATTDVEQCETLLRLGTVPVHVTLAPSEVVSQEAPLPVYMNVPRATLLAALREPVVTAFRPHIADFGHSLNLWLVTPATDARERNGEAVEPLPWHLPVGAIVDREAAAAAPGDETAGKLPFRIVARTSRPRSSKTLLWQLLRPRDVDNVAQQALKQALMVRYRTLKPFYNAAPADIAACNAFALSLAPDDDTAFRRYRGALEKMFQTARAQCLEDGDTPRQGIAVHRDGKTRTLCIDVPFASAVRGAIAEAGEKAAAAAEKEKAKAEEAKAASVNELRTKPSESDDKAAASDEAASAAAAASPEQRGSSSHVDPTSPGPSGAEPASPGGATASDAGASSVETASPVGGPNTSEAHCSSLTLAHAIAACFTDAELAADGCNLSRSPDGALSFDASEPFVHPTLSVSVNGVEPLLGMPLAWAMQHLVYADLVLHFVVSSRNKPQ